MYEHTSPLQASGSHLHDLRPRPQGREPRPVPVRCPTHRHHQGDQPMSATEIKDNENIAVLTTDEVLALAVDDHVGYYFTDTGFVRKWRKARVVANDHVARRLVVRPLHRNPLFPDAHLELEVFYYGDQEQGGADDFIRWPS